ncbi:hypothetical protein QTI66_22035 [Variovorax sp. J22R133]|uniref:hypothetical protein n=1 Tax=Variovorax brevis TaxID=3053503 RepID=UPI002576A65C|nr:hypothetical protein [Variovorax sp. J22R133]MDM0114845.1 hypothetical protein [Variovorax sp. J22R133]
MSEQRPVHVLQPGQQLYSRWREANGQVIKNLKAMRLTPDGGNPDPMVHATFVDDLGLSLYIARSSLYGGDMEAFLPRDLVMWQSYFNPLQAFNQSYVRSRHYTKRFPIDFV